MQSKCEKFHVNRLKIDLYAPAAHNLLSMSRISHTSIQHSEIIVTTLIVCV